VELVLLNDKVYDFVFKRGMEKKHYLVFIKAGKPISSENYRHFKKI